jgi:hypothetical protein
MTRGGARIRSGPPADPTALRRERAADQAGWTTLPSAGRAGDPPAWPLTRPTKRELAVWAGEWARPQAVEWERLHSEIEVAVYVRTLCQAERRSTNASLIGKVMQLQNSLGLTRAGLSANRWRIDDAGTARDDPQPTERPERRASSKRNLLELVVNQ